MTPLGSIHGMFCYKHSLQKCILCRRHTSTEKFDYYCFRCFCHKFPDDRRIKRKRLFKQHYINDNIIDIKYKDELTSYDIRIDSECPSGKKPDWYFEKNLYTIILECDENQHKYTNCEEKRHMKIFQDLGDRPIIFIRFNPLDCIDSYRYRFWYIMETSRKFSYLIIHSHILTVLYH